MHCPKCTHGVVKKCAAKSSFFPPHQCQACQRIFYPSVGRAVRSLLLLLCVAGLSPFWVNWGLRLLVARPDRGETVDAIVVVGRGAGYNQRRATAAVELWKEGRASHIFMSGANDAPVLVDLAKTMGVPADQVSGEACAATTWENAFYTKRYMPVEKSAIYKPKIVLVTDGLHVGRTTLLYRNLGFEVVSHPVGLEFAQWRMQLKREFLAIMYYIATKQIFPPQADKYERANKAADKRIVEWKCLDMEEAFIPHLTQK